MPRTTGDFAPAYKSSRRTTTTRSPRGTTYTAPRTTSPRYFRDETRSDVPVLPGERADVIRPSSLTPFGEVSQWRRSYLGTSMSPDWWNQEAVNWSGGPSQYTPPEIMGGKMPGFMPPKEYLGGGGGDGGWGGDGGGGGAAPTISWTTGTYQAAGPNVPAWWKPWVPTDRALMDQPDVAWTVMANALIPYLSPEDQARVANQLYTVWGKDLTPYSPESVTGGDAWEERDFAFMEGRKQDTSYFMGTQRSQDAIQTLSNLIASEAGGDASKLGSGYRWLQDVLGGVTSTGGGKTRQSYMEMLSNVDPLLATAKGGELGAYGPLGQSLTQPYFTNFNLRPTTQAGTFGRARGSKYLYF